jgi:hypothetical protein
MEFRIPRSLQTWLAAAVVLTTVAAAQAGPGPCVREAKQDAKDCAATCKENLQAAKDACLDRNHACVESCRANRPQCRLDSGLDAAIDACNDALEARRAQCPSGEGRDKCIDEAQIDAFECRDAARELARPLIKQCRKDFRNCAKACPPANPADPPANPKGCMLDANTVAKACNVTCKEEFQIAKDDCRNRDHGCMEQCRADRTICRQPVRVLLDAALATCASNRQDGVDGCTTQFPPPRDLVAETSFDQCVDGVQVLAFVCRDDAHEAARPGFLTCKQNFRTCVNTNCPVLQP